MESEIRVDQGPALGRMVVGIGIGIGIGIGNGIGIGIGIGIGTGTGMWVGKIWSCGRV